MSGRMIKGYLGDALADQRLRGHIFGGWAGQPGEEPAPAWAVVELPDLFVGSGAEWEIASAQMLLLSDVPAYRVKFGQRWARWAYPSPVAELNNRFPLAGDYNYLHKRAQLNDWTTVVGEAMEMLAARGIFAYERGILPLGDDPFMHALAESCRCEQYGLTARLIHLDRRRPAVEFAARRSITSHGSDGLSYVLVQRNPEGRLTLDAEAVRLPARHRPPVYPIYPDLTQATTDLRTIEQEFGPGEIAIVGDIIAPVARQIAAALASK